MLALGFCGIEAETGGSSLTFCHCLETLSAFARCCWAVLLAAWHGDTQGVVLCLAGGAGTAYLLFPLSGAACHFQAVLTSLVRNCLVKSTQCEAI